MPRENDIKVLVSAGLGFSGANSENEYWLGEDLDLSDEEINEYRETGEVEAFMEAVENWFMDYELESGYTINWDEGVAEFYLSNGFVGCDVNDEVDLDDFDFTEDDLEELRNTESHSYLDSYLEDLIANNVEYDYKTLEDTLDKEKDKEIDLC